MFMKRGLFVFLAAGVAMFGAATLTHAQGEMGSIQGTVTDDAGKPLEGVLLKLHDPSKGRDVVAKTDKNGRYYKRGVMGATYELVVELAGYKSITDKMRVAAGGEHRFDFKLAKGAPEGAREFAQGFEAFKRGDNAGAAAFFEAAMAKAPELPEIRVNLAIAYLRLSRKPEAVAQLEEAVKLAANQPRILFQSGGAYVEMRARILFQLGGAYVEMRDFEKAVGAFEQGLGTQPDLKDELALEATITLGAVYFAKGDNDKSIAYFEKALAAKPGAAVPTLGMAKAYLSKGDSAKALELFQQVVSTAPGTPEAAQAEAFISGLKK